MRIGDHVLHFNRPAEIIDQKWGLFCIRYFDTRQQVWVTLSQISKT